jgi:leucyl-tRNA synthetase
MDNIQELIDLHKIEILINEKNINHNFDKTNKKKFFSTLIYLDVDNINFKDIYTSFITRFKEANDYNILLPFSFHCSEKSIIENTKKIKKELLDIDTSNNNPLSQIKKMEVKDINQFTELDQWITFFFEMIKKNTKRYGLPINYNHCFTTTKINPYYDSFVKWHFNKLNKKGILKNNKRYVVISNSYNDDISNKNIQPKEYILFNGVVNGNNYLITVYEKKEINIETNKLYTNYKEMTEITDIFYEIIINKIKYFINENVYNNLKGQYTNIINPKQINSNKFFNNILNIEYNSLYSPTKLFMFVDNITEFIQQMNVTIIKYYEPETHYDLYTVQLMSQDYIDYNIQDGYYKNIVRNYINSTNFNTDENTLKILNNLLDCIDKWHCTRQKGLGIQFLNSENVIDSLSDSTIYMAYSTIAQLIEMIPFDYISEELWECIFMNKEFPENLLDFAEIIFEMRSMFTYWYPVDIIESNNEFTCNHFILCLLNHAFLWNDTTKFPKSFIMNNIINIIEPTDNSMTLQNIIDKYSVSVTFLSLIENNGIINIDILEKNVNLLIKEMNWIISFIESYKQEIDDIKLNCEISIENELNIILKNCYNYYNTNNFYKIIHEGIFKIFSLHHNYENIIKNNQYIILKIINTLITIMRPICYHISEYIIHLLNKKNINYDIQKSWIIKD